MRDRAVNYSRLTSVRFTVMDYQEAAIPDLGSIEASAMPLLEQNISNNEHLFDGYRPNALVLDWDESLPSEVTSIENGFDFIM